jgi:seryl-tRNA synthetase
MTRDNDAIIEIEPVGSGIPAVRLGSGVAPILEALNPLGVIGKAITEILAYRAESKRLDLERERIRAQAKAIDTAIQHKLAYELRQFELQREALLACLTHAETVLQERRATRQALIRSLDNLNGAMTKMMAQKHINPAIISMYRDSLSIISGQLVQLEKAGSSEVKAMSDQLHSIVGDVRRDLEGMPTSRLLPAKR